MTHSGKQMIKSTPRCDSTNCCLQRRDCTPNFSKETCHCRTGNNLSSPWRRNLMLARKLNKRRLSNYMQREDFQTIQCLQSIQRDEWLGCWWEGLCVWRCSSEWGLVKKGEVHNCDTPKCYCHQLIRQDTSSDWSYSDKSKNLTTKHDSLQKSVWHRKMDNQTLGG